MAPPVSSMDAWERRVTALTGHGSQRLRRRLKSDLVVEPLYPEGPVRRLTERPGAWAVCQQYPWERDVAGALALDVQQGLESAWIVLPVGWRSGAVTPDVAALSSFMPSLEALPPRATCIEAGVAASAVASAMASGNPRRSALRVWGDPLGTWARAGQLGPAIEDALTELASACARDTAQGVGTRMLADGCVYRDAGASAAQEIAWVLATALASLRALEAQQLPMQQAWERIVLRVGVGPHLFEEIAKVRALRWLWTRIAARHGDGGRSGNTSIVARTGWRNRGERDVWPNLLRATTEGLAAVVGGADALAVLPLSEDESSVPAADARRWSLNVQHLLRDESHLHEVRDPGAGSGVIEALTEGLARAAWAEVQAIEANGGMAEALRAGRVERAIASQREHDAQVLPRLVGVTLYPPKDVGSAPVRSAPDRSTQALPKITDEAIAAFVPDRLGAPFERAQAAADEYAARHGRRPKAMLAHVGDPSEHAEASQRARELIGALGLEVEESVAPGAAPSAAAPVVAVCGTPEAIGAMTLAEVVGDGKQPVWMFLQRGAKSAAPRGDWSRAMIVTDAAIAWRALAQQITARLEEAR